MGLRKVAVKGGVMSCFYGVVREFCCKEYGVTSIEYVLVASLIALIIIIAVGVLGTRVCERYRSVAEALGAAGTLICS